MKVSLDWLREYVPINMSWEDLANELTLRGLEVESVYDKFDYLKDVVVGRIDSISIHPNSHDLLLCIVDYGKKPVTVVCGAKNIEVGMLVAVALPGAVMPSGEVVRKKKIREYNSSAVLCSEYELGIGEDREDIMTVRGTLELGQSIKDVLFLYEPILEINLTPNRPDCSSMIGIAREVAAIQNVKMYPRPNSTGASLVSSGSENNLTSISIDASSLEKCSCYLARFFYNIEVKSSPLWIRKRLTSAGLKPINNVVDITNFVMLETGQPLHAFDLDLLSGNSIVVKNSKAKETFKTLDENNLVLSEGMLVICDSNEPIAVAGIIGGFKSRVTEKTSNIFLECAYFNPDTIRMTSKKLSVSTESSYRFERGIDPKGLFNALEIASMMISDLTNGYVANNYVYEDIEKKKTENIIELSVGKTNRILGTALSSEKMSFYLSSVDFFVKPDGDRLQVTVPSFRVDIKRQEDLMEEIARLHGYDKIPVTLPKLDFLKPTENNTKEEHVFFIKSVLNGLGFSEIINYSFVDSESCDRLNLMGDFHKEHRVKIINPISSSQSMMRFSLLPSFLNTLSRNISRQIKRLAFFEIGNVFSLDINNVNNKLPIEKEMLLAMYTGPRIESSWCIKEEYYDFFDIKGSLEELLASLNVINLHFTKIADSLYQYMRKGNTARVFSSSVGDLGIVGEVSYNVLNAYSIKQRVFIFELDISQLCKCIPESKFVKPVPMFPGISRDATIIVSEEVESASLLENIKDINEKLVYEINLLDIFKGPSVKVGMKSVSFRIVYRSEHMTLDDKMVNTIHRKLIEQLVSKFNASLP